MGLNPQPAGGCGWGGETRSYFSTWRKELAVEVGFPFLLSHLLSLSPLPAAPGSWKLKLLWAKEAAQRSPFSAQHAHGELEPAEQ